MATAAYMGEWDGEDTGRPLVFVYLSICLTKRDI